MLHNVNNNNANCSESDKIDQYLSWKDEVLIFSAHLIFAWWIPNSSIGSIKSCFSKWILIWSRYFCMNTGPGIKSRCHLQPLVEVFQLIQKNPSDTYWCNYLRELSVIKLLCSEWIKSQAAVAWSFCVLHCVLDHLLWLEQFVLHSHCLTINKTSMTSTEKTVV